ncbi:MAG TPA: hypothetical protein VG819_11510 [Rhizomicrobium sp.]|nr:hypothetical protein [Rhizomicrobium sp.]
MIPMLAVLRIERAGHPRVRLWLPLFVLWLLALPVLLVTLPVVALILAAGRENPLPLFAAYWDLLSAVAGSHVEMRGRRGIVHVHVY